MSNKFYITTTIGGIATPPHIGHALELVQADVIARWHRILGEKVFFLCGADENNLKNVYRAKKEKISIEKFCDLKTEEFLKLKTILNLSYDGFIRTGDKRQHFVGASRLWKECGADIYKKIYQGWYCSECGQFQRAEGRRVCVKHGIDLKFVAEENYFFRLSKYKEILERLLINDQIEIVPFKKKKEALNFICKGLEDISISRPVTRTEKWGVPVPGDPDHTQYSWFDALSAYLTGIGYGVSERRFEQWWPANVHMIGKSLFRFHCAYWPAILISAGIKLPKKVFIHGFLSINKKRVSDLSNHSVGLAELVKRYGMDSIRYYLLRQISPFEDGDVSHSKLRDLYNGDLANGLGNFTSRVLKLFSLTTFAPSKTSDFLVLKKVEDTKKIVYDEMSKFEFGKALMAIWSLIHFGDRYLDEKKPWKAGNRNILVNLINVLDSIQELLTPFLPGASEVIRECIRNRKGINKVLFPRICN